MQEEIHILFPKVSNQFNVYENSFTINQMRCRTVSVVYFMLHAYLANGTELLIDDEPLHIGERWAVDETWSSYTETFDIPSDTTNSIEAEDILSQIKDFQIELVLINIDDDNPLHFTECMLANTPFEDYFDSNETISEATIEFINNTYVNLYSNNQEGDYLQVIRPYSVPFSNTVLNRSKCTVLAPHIISESNNDKPQNLFFEFMNQTEQETNIKPI